MGKVEKVYIHSDSEEDITSIAGLLESIGWEFYRNFEGWKGAHKVLGGPSKDFFVVLNLKTKSLEDFTESLKPLLTPFGLDYTTKTAYPSVILKLVDKGGS